MGLYLNPKMVDWFNEWQSTPDLLGVDLDDQNQLLNEAYQFDSVWLTLNSDEQSDELKSWLFFFMSLYEEDWMDTSVYTENQDYWEWLKAEVLEGNNPEYGLNQEMIKAMVENYQSNFINEFEEGGNMWWPWNFVHGVNDKAPTYPPLFGHKPQREFEGILNWINENPLEVKQ